MTGRIVLSSAPAKQTSTTTASSRALSPVRSPRAVPALPRMPSPRTSPSIRPSSPLSPGYKATHFESLQPPSPRNMHSRSTGNSGRRANNASLKLPSLPRFHPANFPSGQSSLQPTPDAPSPNGPVSPRAHQRMLSDAQKHLYLYQREMVSAARSASPGGEKPDSPRLAPLGSPGPVTPLELEGSEGYLVAGAKSAGKDARDADELVDRIIREEASRRRPRSSRSPAGPSAR